MDINPKKLTQEIESAGLAQIADALARADAKWRYAICVVRRWS